MAVYKPYGKTASGKEEIKIPYSSIDGTPTIPTVNNGTLTIQKNGTTVETFSANQKDGTTANITVPTKVSELENDSGFTKNTGTVTSVAVKMNGEEKGKVTSSGTIDLGTVITAHQDISGLMPKSGGTFTGNISVPKIITFTDNTNPFIKMTTGGTDFYFQSTSGQFGLGPTWNKATHWDSNGNVTFPTTPKVGSTSLALTSQIPTSSTVSDWGFTKNTGTITGIKMNGESKGTSDVVDLGTVLTDASKFATSTQGTKADNAMPKAGGAFTGAVTVQAPTAEMNPATKQYVDTVINAVKQFEYQVVTELPTAAQATMGKIYLKAHSHNPSDGQPDSYDEFITVQSGSTYKWERIGNTDIDLSGYVPTTRKINNKALSSDINLGASDVGVTEEAFPGLNKTGTVTGIKMNGTSKGTSGVVDLGTVITAHQDISGKQDKITTSNKLSASLVSGLATVATSGSYNDLSNKPTFSFSNGVLTITTTT